MVPVTPTTPMLHRHAVLRLLHGSSYRNHHLRSLVGAAQVSTHVATIDALMAGSLDSERAGFLPGSCPATINLTRSFTYYCMACAHSSLDRSFTPHLSPEFAAEFLAGCDCAMALPGSPHEAARDSATLGDVGVDTVASKVLPRVPTADAGGIEAAGGCDAEIATPLSTLLGDEYPVGSYPQQPYILLACKQLWRCVHDEDVVPPALAVMAAGCFTEDTSVTRLLETVRPLLKAKLWQLDCLSAFGVDKDGAIPLHQQQLRIISDVVDLIGKERGLLALIGMRWTAGSTTRLPPSINALRRSFNARHNDGKSSKFVSLLTVGARAWAKHSHRDSSKWWGECKGSEAVKCDAANKLLEKLLADAVWVNCHWLPHDEVVVEVRVKEGFGARWSVSGDAFRGFLEPPMDGGHLLGWRH